MLSTLTTTDPIFGLTVGQFLLDAFVIVVLLLILFWVARKLGIL